jgi:hypothetical protein
MHSKGYVSHDDTWEPLRNLENCQELVNEYDNKFRQLHNPHVFTIQSFLI